MTRLLLLVCAFLLAAAAATAAQPAVVATIAPLHGLVAAVMGEAGHPVLLLDPRSSPHSHHLRPSEAQLLRSAELIVWIGPSFETFLEPALEGLPPQTRVFSALDRPLPVLLPYAEPPGGEESEHEHGHGHEGSIDPHIWLEPANAAAIALALADELAMLDPSRARVYRANAEALADRLRGLQAELEAKLAPVRGRGFVTAHEAFRYFAHAFGLRFEGAFALDPEVPAGAARQAELIRQVQAGSIACLVVEPQFEPRVVTRLARETGVPVAVLDPLGADLPPGPDLYPRLLERNVDALARCLEAGRPG